MIAAVQCDSSISPTAPSLSPGKPDTYFRCNFIHDVDSLTPAGCDTYVADFVNEETGAVIYTATSTYHTRGAVYVQTDVANLTPFPRKVNLAIDYT